jgi:hypothetical protein
VSGRPGAREARCQGGPVPTKAVRGVIPAPPGAVGGAGSTPRSTRWCRQKVRSKSCGFAQRFGRSPYQ